MLEKRHSHVGLVLDRCHCACFAGAGPDADAPVDTLQGLPRAVRELSIAAVGAAHARDSLDHYTLEAEALSRDTTDAAARMPEVQAAAMEAQADLNSRTPALLEVEFCPLMHLSAWSCVASSTPTLLRVPVFGWSFRYPVSAWANGIHCVCRQ